MKPLSLEAKQAIIKKALNQHGQSLAQIAAANNVGYSTLQKWIRRYREEENPESAKPSNEKLSQAERFDHLVATANLDDTALGAYCREHGLYSFDLKQWKESFMKKNDSQQSKKDQTEIKALRSENKLLKIELNRKDKALAETTALLVLKKKAHILWGILEEDS